MAPAKDHGSSAETRRRILDSARELFSRFGYDGTSIRDIAGHCEVNLAAINYHFKNKETLFWEIIDDGFRTAQELAATVSGEASDVADFASRLFHRFQSERDLVRNTMKLMLSGKMVPPENSIAAERMRKNLGPPGAEFLAAQIAREVPFPINEMGLKWAVKSIFGSVLHWATMCHTVHFESICVKDPLMSPTQLGWDIGQMANAVVQHLRANPKLFEVNENGYQEPLV